MSELTKAIEDLKIHMSWTGGSNRLIDLNLLVKRLEEIDKGPELTDDQKTLLEDLKHVYSWQHSHAWDLFYYLVDKDTQMFEEDTISLFYNMSEEESLQVQILFSQWVLQQEENHE